MKNAMQILIFTDFYLPGFKGGGPIRTIANMVEALGNHFDFSIVALDRDFGDSAPYPSLNSEFWQLVGKAQVCYLSPGDVFRNTLKIVSNFRGDALHLNSFFSFRFGILPFLIARFYNPNLPIIIGPRGEFSKGALSLKSFKKRIYILIVKSLSLYKSVVWHASTLHEAEDIRCVMGDSVTIRTALDIAVPSNNLVLTHRKEGAPLKVVFISRISPKKNLLASIEILKNVRCAVDFDVYGPIEDLNYWNECRTSAATLPSHVSFGYHGSLQADLVSQKLSEYDLFLFPSLGENFGHVIAEALFAGLPVLISNTTPWRELEDKELGWDLKLDEPEMFARCIEACHSKPAAEYNQWRQKIRGWALQSISNRQVIEQNRILFLNLMRTNNA